MSVQLLSRGRRAQARLPRRLYVLLSVHHRRRSLTRGNWRRSRPLRRSGENASNDQPLWTRNASMSAWNVVRRTMSLKKYDRGVPFSVTTRWRPSSVSCRRSERRSPRLTKIQTGSAAPSPVSGPGGSAVIADHHDRYIVALRRAGAERVHVGDERIEHLLRRLAEVRGRAGEEPVVGELLVLGIHRLGHAVAEGDDQIAGLQRDGFFLERRLLEQAEDHAAFFQAADARRAHQKRRVVAGVAVGERSVRSEHAVEGGEKPR